MKLTDEDVRSLVLNVVGGFLASLVTAIAIWFYVRFQSFSLDRVLGGKPSRSSAPAIVYGQLSLPLQGPAGIITLFLYAKTPRKAGPPPKPQTFRMDHPVSECEVRASNYLARMLGKAKAADTRLVSDVVAVEGNDGSFIALGGPGSNFKTEDILVCDTNIFVAQTSAFFPDDPQITPSYRGTLAQDYGFILRIRSPFFPSESLIVCAGRGEWGTSGAAWFLANKWQELRRHGDAWKAGKGFLRQPDFFAVVKVTEGQDDSATLVNFYNKKRGKVFQVK